MSDDAVDAVVLAFLDYLEGVAPRPTLEHLTDADRPRAEALLAGLVAGRGIDPNASRPSVESLLVGTPLAGLFPEVTDAGGEQAGGVDLTTVQRVLGDVDSRALVAIDSASATVVYSYLDLRARFLLVATATPVITEEVRAAVGTLFDTDPDTSRVGVVAAGSDELLTQVLSADDVGPTITTPRGEPHLRWDPRLPLALAARRILEQCAPEWPSFDFDQAQGEALDLATVAADIARRVIERESARSYRGDKRRAYKALVGHERVFAELVVKVSAPGSNVDLDEETTRILQAAA
jgi:hypothetical protein